MLFTPYSLQSLSLNNRIVMSPMCTYSCEDESGKVTDWHKVHYASRAIGQVGLILLEATAVTPEGRISPHDLGLWHDEQIEGMKELVSLIHLHGAKVGIQLGHAGRKAKGGASVFAPSALPFDSKSQTPQAMTLEQIKEVIEAFGQAARRCKAADMDVIEIHAAHGYLINQFLSPLTNHREDEYGGDADRRYHFLHDIITAVRSEWTGPLLVRISANEYDPSGLNVNDHIVYGRRLKEQGVDLLDVSTGGVIPVVPETYPGYQISYAETIRREAGIPTSAVGLITEAVQAEEIVRSGRADLVMLGRELLRNPYWPREAAKKLGSELTPPKAYQRGW